MMTIFEAAKRVLSDEKRPLRPNEIADIALKRGYVATQGKTLGQSFSAALSTHVRNGGKSVMKIGPKYSGVKCCKYEQLQLGVVASTTSTKKGNNTTMKKPKTECKSTSKVSTIEHRLEKFCTEYESELGNLSRDMAFGPFCAKYLYFEDSAKDIDKDFAKRVPDGSKDGGIDVVFVNPNDSSELVILQGKHYPRSNIELQRFKDNINEIIDTVHALQEGRDSDVNEKLRHAFAVAKNDLDDCDNFKVRIDFCALCECRKTKVAEFDAFCRVKERETGFDIQFYDCDRLEEVVSTNETESAYISSWTLKIDSADNMLKYGKSAVVNVSATTLKDLYNSKGNRVLGKNLRYHIRNKTVDEAICYTIRNVPDRFWYFNNGILIACNDFKLEGTNLRLEKFSIVNGGQTVYQIARQDISPTSDFFVQCKIVKMSALCKSPIERDALCTEISKATNAQKAIKLSDLKSNNEEQRQLKEGLEKFGYFYTVKAGDKPKEKKRYPSQNIVTFDKIGKACLAGVLLRPGSARSSAGDIYESCYDRVFKETRAGVVADVLTLTNCVINYKKLVTANPEDNGYTEGDIPFQILKNGERWCVACIGFLSKIKRKVFSYQDFSNLIHRGDDGVRELFKKGTSVARILRENDPEKVQRIVFGICNIMVNDVLVHSYEIEKHGDTNAVSNTLKVDSFFFQTVLPRLWNVYQRQNSDLKKLIDQLLV